MISFEYVIKEPVGIHARPAGLLNKEARKYKSANVLRLMALMQLGVKCGETVKVTIEGEDEATVAPIVEEFFKANF